MTVLSVLVKNPITSLAKDESLVCVEYETEEKLLTGIAGLPYDGGFTIRKTEKKTFQGRYNMCFVEYKLECSTKYAEQHKESNQASWYVTVLVVEDKND